MHNIHDAEENYLEAIYVLGRDQKVVRSVDVARHLDITRASVSNALKKLEKDGYARMLDNGDLTLTEEGLRIGKLIDERHQTLKKWFESIGVTEETAEQDACRIEHAISQETFDRIKDRIKLEAKEGTEG